MESLREDDLRGMNASAGGLVWVRRRNGSWWPGRILCVDELAKCLRTKKAGTPVKLLGREEGTVDWYNLEKSKRIKAFRCGEYDDCIARAKASAIRLERRTTNSGKYARRVDAILQALELEKCHLPNGNEKLSSSRNNSKVSYIAEDLLKQQKMMFKNKRDFIFTARKSGKPKGICTNELSHSIASFERPGRLLNSAVKKKRWKTPNDSEDDGDEGIRRMKDLQDLGLGMVSTGKPNMHASVKETCAKYSSLRASQNEPDFDNNLSSVSLISSFKHSCFPSKRTRLFQVYQNLKRRNRRRRRLAKIWVGSDNVNVNVPLIYQDSVITGDSPSYGITMKRLNDLKSSSKRTKFSFTDNSGLNCSESSYERTLLHVEEKNGNAVLDFNSPSVVRDDADGSLSNGLVNVPILIGEGNVEGVLSIRKTCTSRKINSAAEKLSVRSIQVCLVSKSGGGLVEASSTNSVSPANHLVRRFKKTHIGINSRVKGHSRYSTLNMNQNLEASDDEAGNACDGSLTSDISDQSVRCGSLTELSNMHEAQTVPSSISSATANDFQCIYKSLQSGNNLQRSYSTSSAQLKGALREVPTSTMQVQDSDKREQSVVSISPRCAIVELSNSASVATLYDVELKVQANYHGQRAPLVSLVSKLNGKAIVGHAIAVDILGDGSSATLLNSVRHLTGCSINLLRNRVNIICKLREKLDHLAKSKLSVQEKTCHLSCMSSSLLKRKPLGGRNLSCKNSSLLKRKPLSGRKSSFSPRKIRRLSSITVALNNRDNGREVIVEKVEPSSVSCIPLRVVFSRLNEALSCSSHPTN